MLHPLYNSKTAAYTLAALHMARREKGFSVQAWGPQSKAQQHVKSWQQVYLQPQWHERQKIEDHWGFQAASLVLGPVKDPAWKAWCMEWQSRTPNIPFWPECCTCMCSSTNHTYTERRFIIKISTSTYTLSSTDKFINIAQLKAESNSTT